MFMHMHLHYHMIHLNNLKKYLVRIRASKSSTHIKIECVFLILYNAISMTYQLRMSSDKKNELNNDWITNDRRVHIRVSSIVSVELKVLVGGTVAEFTGTINTGDPFIITCNDHTKARDFLTKLGNINLKKEYMAAFHQPDF